MIKNVGILIFLLFSSFFSSEAQMASATDYPKGPFFERMYQPRQRVIQGDTIQVRPRWFFPAHAKIQFAGSVGFFSVGAGYRFWEMYEPTLSYGLLAKKFGRSDVTVHTISLKNSFYLTRLPWFNHFWPKAGMLVNLGNTKNTFHRLPAHYPEKYYFQNRIHLAPFWGGEWHFPLRDKHLTGIGIYFEFSALDAYLLEAVRTDYVSMMDVWSFAAGLTIYFQ